jgi:hypothetical protein
LSTAQEKKLKSKNQYVFFHIFGRVTGCKQKRQKIKGLQAAMTSKLLFMQLLASEVSPRNFHFEPLASFLGPIPTVRLKSSCETLLLNGEGDGGVASSALLCYQNNKTTKLSLEVIFIVIEDSSR